MRFGLWMNIPRIREQWAYAVRRGRQAVQFPRSMAEAISLIPEESEEILFEKRSQDNALRNFK